jgi:hypothetical protein
MIDVVHEAANKVADLLVLLIKSKSQMVQVKKSQKRR